MHTHMLTHTMTNTHVHTSTHVYARDDLLFQGFSVSTVSTMSSRRRLVFPVCRSGRPNRTASPTATSPAGRRPHDPMLRQ